MPIYEYVCRSCNHAFEAIVYGSRRPRCPKCEGARLDKQLSVFATSKSAADNGDFATPGACESCGDPRGPGSCALD